MKPNASAKNNLSPKQRDELLAALKVRFDANKGPSPRFGVGQGAGAVGGQAGQAVVARGNGTHRRQTGCGVGQVGRIRFHGLRARKSSRPAQRVLRPRRLVVAEGGPAQNRGDGFGGGDGHRAVDGGGIPRAAKAGEFDTKTSSWIATLADFREQGGALWGGRGYGRVFIGCNGAQSYYAARGFRGAVRV